MCFANNYNQKERDIVVLLETMEVTEMGIQVVLEMIDSFKIMAPEVPDRFWRDFVAEMKAGDMIDIYVPIYNKYFTHQDIKELINFYDSPIGKKMIKVEPYILQESMIEGEKWGEKIGTKLLQNLEKYVE